MAIFGAYGRPARPQRRDTYVGTLWTISVARCRCQKMEAGESKKKKRTKKDTKKEKILSPCSHRLQEQHRESETVLPMWMLDRSNGEKNARERGKCFVQGPQQEKGHAPQQEERKRGFREQRVETKTISHPEHQTRDCHRTRFPRSKQKTVMVRNGRMRCSTNTFPEKRCLSLVPRSSGWKDERRSPRKQRKDRRFLGFRTNTRPWDVATERAHFPKLRVGTRTVRCVPP
mmetsp:Transcript_6167/g.15223  ORF Transcript_6167/g.15223 Transcript_6167/m.15223 type:complete len:230 (+) Transcript_6167:9346-10035(+)